jgi:uncharacterized protein (DUF736 family)
MGRSLLEGSPHAEQGDAGRTSRPTSFWRIDGFIGTVRTLTLNVKVRFIPNDKASENAPDFRVQAAGGYDRGAAWKKVSQSERPYLSVTLDDPSFPATIYARLIEKDDGTHNLNQGRADHVLVVIRSAGAGLVARLAAETQWRTCRREQFAARGSRAAAGKSFAPEGCGHEDWGAAAPAAGCTTAKGRMVRSRGKAPWPTRYPRITAAPAGRPEAGKEQSLNDK